MDERLSSIKTLRRREHVRRRNVLRQPLPEAPGEMARSVTLFGSLARGDWDGFSERDLLLVAAAAGAQALRLSPEP